MRIRQVKVLISFVLVALVGCATSVPNDSQYSKLDLSQLPKRDVTANIPGLVPCTNSGASTVALNSNEPVYVLVHGCFGSAARFRALAQVFAFHGQQAICFTYDDRESMELSANNLFTALDQLGKTMSNPNLTLVAHSQGGLITRKALVNERSLSWARNDINLHLVTVSAPFSGIQSASNCVSPGNLVLSLGLALPVCRLISGAKWFEITRYSDFIKKPGTLVDAVKGHLQIVTDERNSCREYSPVGNCIKDDFVFSTQEQLKDAIGSHDLVETINVKAGHSEIVGDHEIPPRKLISILQQKNVLRPTQISRMSDFENLLFELYE